MVCSNARKLLLSGWLRENNIGAYTSALKLQKFLLFYEAFTKMDGETADFSHLKGYRQGPVFRNVWGDYIRERISFDMAAEAEYAKRQEGLNTDRAGKSCFLVSVLSEKELSDLTHKMNIWKAKEERIMSGEYQVELSETDFNDDDAHLMRLLDQMYPPSLISNSAVIHIDNHCFVFSKQDAKKLTEQHYDVLCSVSESGNLMNPVYVEMDDQGRLVID